MKLPENLEQMLAGQPFSAETAGLSAAEVRIYPDSVLKAEPRSEKAALHVAMLRWMHGRLPVPEVFCCENDAEMQYLLMSRIRGQRACSPYYLERPKLLAKLLADAMQQLWLTDLTDCPRVVRWTICSKRGRSVYGRILSIRMTRKYSGMTAFTVRPSC